MREVVTLSTNRREELVDITELVAGVVRRSNVSNGLVSVYAQGATAAVMIQENWDESVQTDVVDLLHKLIPRGVWLHDQQDGNGGEIKEVPDDSRHPNQEADPPHGDPF